MKKFVIDQTCWNLFPKACFGVVVAHDIPTGDEISEEIRCDIQQALKKANVAAQKHLTHPTLSQNEVVAAWRSAYQQFKTKRGARCSIENLLKRILKDNPVGSINPLVDIYNTISLTYAIPSGGEDLDALSGDMVLRITHGGDDFIPLGSEEQDPTLEGELAYMDDAGAVCRCWNWRDGVRTALREDSRNAVFIMEYVDSSRRSDMEQAVQDLTAMLVKLGATVTTNVVVDHDNPSVDLA